MYTPSIVNERVDALSRKLGISKSLINQECQLSPNAIINSTKTENGMKAKNLCTIADFLDCSVDYLLGRTDNPYSHKSNLSVTVENVSDNKGAIGVGNTVMETVDKQAGELLDLYTKLSTANKARLFLYADELTQK